MHGLIAIFAPIALLLPLGGVTMGPSASGPISQLDPEKVEKIAKPETLSETPRFDAFYSVPVQRQVRIERRVTIRIAPQQTAPRQNLIADLPRQAAPPKYEERKMEKCLPIEGISGVQTGSGNRLLLYLRDKRVVSAKLEKSCRSRDFYSGFYLERNKDGKLCVDRDKLQSRAGAKCEIDRFRHLVALED
ncbi:MAG: hypothetical protein ABJ239_10410 [Erythrobacter sp.]